MKKNQKNIPSFKPPKLTKTDMKVIVGGGKDIKAVGSSLPGGPSTF